MPSVEKTFNIDNLSEEIVKKNVLPYYNLEKAKICRIKFKNTDKQRAIYKVTDGYTNYCLKKVYFPKGELLYVYSAIEWLYRKGINVPRILPTIDNSRFVNFDNMLFILTPWIEGEKCNYDIMEHIIKSSKNLALIHKKCADFVPIKESTFREGCTNICASFQKHFEQLLIFSNIAFRYKDKFSNIFLDNFENNMMLAKNALEVSTTINYDNLSKSLCHMDYVNKNILLDTEGRVWTIDFDKSRFDYCAHDISYFLRRILKRNSTNWDINVAIDSINAYEKVHPLNLDEYKYILVYLTFPQKYWKISRDYYKNINKCNKNAFIQFLSGACNGSDHHLKFFYEMKNYIENKFETKL